MNAPRTLTPLEESEQRFRQIAETVSHVFWIFDLWPEPHVPYVNPAFERVWGRKPEELYADARIWIESIHPEDRARVVEAHDRWASDPNGQRYEEEYRIIRSDGQVRWIFDHGRAVRNADGKIYRVTGVAEDITERKEHAEQIRRLNRELEARVRARTEALKRANEELEAFSYSVSHDLRAPLRTIGGFAQAVLEDYGALLPEEGQRYLRTIRQGAQCMGRLIDTLLRFSRLNRLPIQKRAVNMRELVTRCLEDLTAERVAPSPAIEVGEMPDAVGEPSLLKQVWFNLLSNALKYSAPREHPRIEVGAFRDQGGTPVYFVRDNGVGFEMAYAHKLFGVFQRLHREDEFEGTGVGLALVQRVVQRHGGRVWAEATPGQGACFYFTLDSVPTKPHTAA
jgi:PAS domain S-box-containing protein